MGATWGDPGGACDIKTKIESVENEIIVLNPPLKVTQGTAMPYNKAEHAFLPKVGGISSILGGFDPKFGKSIRQRDGLCINRLLAPASRAAHSAPASPHSGCRARTNAENIALSCLFFWRVLSTLPAVLCCG